MKKIILSQNFNGWCPVNKNITYSEKITLFADYLRWKYANLTEVAVICIQEFIGGRNGRYLKQLEESFNHSYDIITPSGFNQYEHPRSLLTITMVRKELEYMPIKFESCLPNRISYVKVWLENTPIPLRIMNVYAVQTAKFAPGAAAWYMTERKEEKEELWTAILSEAEKCSDALLICGDMQEGSKTGLHIKKLTDMGFKEKNGGFFPTVQNEIFEAEQNIDHFLYNPRAWNNFYPLFLEYDGNLLNELSDHILLAATSA